MVDVWAALWREDEGVTAVEYGLIVALVFLVMVASVKALGSRSSGLYTSVKIAVETAE
jgi:pilus assembly protein Flp/PilA